MVGERLFRVDADDEGFLPVRSRAREGVRQIFPVFRDRAGSERGGSVFGKSVRVEEGFRLPAVLSGHVENRLILEPVVFEVKDAALLFERHGVFHIVEPPGHFGADFVPERNLIEIRPGQLVFRRNPRGGLRRAVVFEPPVRIGDRNAKIIVRLTGDAGNGIVECAGAAGQQRQAGKRRNEEREILIHGRPLPILAVGR